MIDAALRELAPHLANPDESRDAVAEIIAAIITNARMAALDDLRTVAHAAQSWHVSERRARAYIATLHERHGVGFQFGGTWVLTQDEIDQYPPGQPGRPRQTRQERHDHA